MDDYDDDDDNNNNVDDDDYDYDDYGVDETMMIDGWYHQMGRMTHLPLLTRWGRVMHICVVKLTNLGSYNGWLPDRHQASILTNAGMLLIGPLGKKLEWNLNRSLCIFVQENTFENIVWKMAAILSQPQYVKVRSWNNGMRCMSFFILIVKEWATYVENSACSYRLIVSSCKVTNNAVRYGLAWATYWVNSAYG